MDGVGRLAHWRWVSREDGYIPVLDRQVILGPADAYMYDGYTAPEFRGQGVDGAVRCYIFRCLREAGARYTYSYVRGDNPVGLRAARRWQQPVGGVRYLRFRNAS